MADQASEFGKAFVAHYYAAFDADRSQLAGLYHPQSMLTFEGAQVVGQAEIAKKLTSLPFTQVQHAVTTTDVQPMPALEGACIISVMGQLKTDNDPPHGFSQVFTLLPFNGGNVIVNDMFRLALHNA